MLLLVLSFLFSINTSAATETPEVLALFFEKGSETCKWQLFDSSTSSPKTLRTTNECPEDIAWDFASKKVYYAGASIQVTDLTKPESSVETIKFPKDYNPDNRSELLLAIVGPERRLRMAYSACTKKDSSKEDTELGKMLGTDMSYYLDCTRQVAELQAKGQWKSIKKLKHNSEVPIEQQKEVLNLLKPTKDSLSYLTQQNAITKPKARGSCDNKKIKPSLKNLCDTVTISKDQFKFPKVPFITSDTYDYSWNQYHFGSSHDLFIIEAYEVNVDDGESFVLAPALLCKKPCKSIEFMGTAKDYTESPSVFIVNDYALVGNHLFKSGSNKPYFIFPNSNVVLFEPQFAPIL